MASGSGAHGCSYSQRPGTDSWEEEQKKKVTLVSWGLNAVFATECSIFQMTELLTADLKKFLIYLTGNPSVLGNHISLDFIERAFTVSTCSKTFSISTSITDFSSFCNGLHLLMASSHFTMP